MRIKQELISLHLLQKRILSQVRLKLIQQGFKVKEMTKIVLNNQFL